MRRMRTTTRVPAESVGGIATQARQTASAVIVRRKRAQTDRPVTQPRTTTRNALAASLLLGGLLLVTLRVIGQKNGDVDAPITYQRQLMGTLWIIRVLPQEEISREEMTEAIERAFTEVERVEGVMSEWRVESPISRVNSGAGGEPVEAPQELIDIVRRAVQIGELTDGAFDVTWRALGSVWRFDDDAPLPPTPGAVQEALSAVDFRRLSIGEGRIGLPEPDMAIGLGGVAKGYGVDRAAAVLREAGLNNFYIDGGGDVYVAGDAGDRPWRVGIRDPRGNRDDLIAIVEAESSAVVSSGDYERYRVVAGVRYHHIIDPRTGWPADQCQAVSIIAESAEWADAMATGVFVLGPDAGLSLIDGIENTEALIVDSSGRIRVSQGFDDVGRLIER